MFKTGSELILSYMGNKNERHWIVAVITDLQDFSAKSLSKQPKLWSRKGQSFLSQTGGGATRKGGIPTVVLLEVPSHSICKYGETEACLHHRPTVLTGEDGHCLALYSFLIRSRRPMSIAGYHLSPLYFWLRDNSSSPSGLCSLKPG